MRKQSVAVWLKDKSLHSFDDMGNGIGPFMFFVRKADDGTIENVGFPVDDIARISAVVPESLIVRPEVSIVDPNRVS